MKKLIPAAAILTLIVFAFAAHAAKPIEATTNLAVGKSAYGTYANLSAATDGKLRMSYATSGDLTDTPQYLTIDLGKSMYLDRIRISWDKSALSNDFVIRTSPDAKYWNEEAAGLDASTGVLDASGNMTMSISLKRSSLNSRYVQVMVPAGTKITNPKGNFVRIAEVEVYPAVAQKFTLDTVGPYVITDKMCIIKYKTSIGAASGTINYGTDPNKLSRVSINSEFGVDNSAVLSGLNPRTIYFYQVKTGDSFGNTLYSKVGSFTTERENVALNKKVTGTFINPPVDKYAKPGSSDEILARVTDGKTSYFTAMAQSGSVDDADQYVVIDLGRSYKIKDIVSYWRRLAYPESLIVQLSDNNTDWTALADGVNAGAGGFARSDAGDPMQALKTAGGAGRYVKLLVKKGSPAYHKHSNWNFVQLMEVEVYTE